MHIDTRTWTWITIIINPIVTSHNVRAQIWMILDNASVEQTHLNPQPGPASGMSYRGIDRL